MISVLFGYSLTTEEAYRKLCSLLDDEEREKMEEEKVRLGKRAKREKEELEDDYGKIVSKEDIYNSMWEGWKELEGYAWFRNKLEEKGRGFTVTKYRGNILVGIEIKNGDKGLSWKKLETVRERKMRELGEILFKRDLKDELRIYIIDSFVDY